MPSNNKSKLEQLRAIVDAATPGPWTTEQLYEDAPDWSVEGPSGSSVDWHYGKPDATFIATFNPELVAKLLDGLEVLEELARMSTASGVEDWARDVLNSITGLL